MSTMPKQLPSKREAAATATEPDAKKSKADAQRASKARAREWAETRKKKKACTASEDRTADEENDVVADLPLLSAAPAARKSSRRRGQSKAVAAALAADGESDTELSVGSVGSRTRSRRRTTGAPATSSAMANVTTSATSAKDRRGKTPKEVAIQVKPAKEKVKTAEEEKAAQREEVAKDDPPTGVEVAEQNEPQVEIEEAQKTRNTPETPGEELDDTATNCSRTHHPFAETLLPSISLFFHALLIEWTLTFGFILTVAFEWWIFHGAGQDGMDALQSQREVCFVLGLWMISIGFNSMTFGSQSRFGWIVTTASLAMLFIAPSSAFNLPICVIAESQVSVPDVLLGLGVIGACAALMANDQLPAEKQASTEDTTAADENADGSDMQSEELDDGNIEEREATLTGPRSLIGQKVSSQKDGFALSGTVKAYLPVTREWRVIWDDGSPTEDLNRIELASAFKLYSKNLADSLKLMWRNGEV